MEEKVLIRQNKAFNVAYMAPDPRDPESGTLKQVQSLHEVTPYGMLLTGLGSCTADVLITYANHHAIPLEEVELRLEYHRSYKEDCKDCVGIDRYEEKIFLELEFFGESLQPQDRKKLAHIALQCPIHKMLHRGIDIVFSGADGPE
jgi:uncharacterized OsmC-like protein